MRCAQTVDEALAVPLPPAGIRRARALITFRRDQRLQFRPHCQYRASQVTTDGFEAHDVAVDEQSKIVVEPEQVTYLLRALRWKCVQAVGRGVKSRQLKVNEPPGLGEMSVSVFFEEVNQYTCGVGMSRLGNLANAECQ